MSTHEPLGPRPSDEELMMLLDGELDEPRRAEVASWAGSDAELGGKLDGLGLVSSLVREGAGVDSRADGIADAVMAELESPRAASGGAEVVALPTRAGRRGRWLGGASAANDNSRHILWMAGLAAAVAAGLFFWSRAGIKDMPLTDGSPATAGASATAVALGPSGSGPEPKWLPPAATAEQGADEGATPVVEVAAVDFGTNTGSVFYVSTGASQANTTTAVIWVTDKVAGK